VGGVRFPPFPRSLGVTAAAPAIEAASELTEAFR
jgi:hypothetical protein